MADKTLFSPLPSYPLGAKGLSRSTQRGKVISPPHRIMNARRGGKGELFAIEEWKKERIGDAG